MRTIYMLGLFIVFKKMQRKAVRLIADDIADGFLAATTQPIRR